MATMRTRHRRDWSQEANCRDTDVETYFGTEAELRSNKTIRSLCDKCPVVVECREYSILHEEYGYWAGLTPNQRKLARKTILDSLAWKAVKENWLEDYSLVPEELLQEYRELNRRIKKPAKRRPVVLEFDVPEIELF